jgi:hypothetical protein
VAGSSSVSIFMVAVLPQPTVPDPSFSIEMRQSFKTVSGSSVCRSTYMQCSKRTENLRTNPRLRNQSWVASVPRISVGMG